MPEARSRADEAAGERRFLVFAHEGRSYAFAAHDVAEIVRVPALARVPQAPEALAGLGNVRGRITPFADLAALIDMGIAGGDRAVVLSGASPAAVIIPGAPYLVAADTSLIESAERAQVLARQGELLKGAFRAGEDESVHVLDIEALLKRAFAFHRAERTTGSALRPGRQADTGRNTDDELKILSFMVAGQEFALELTSVREIISAPDAVVASPHSDDPVVGVAAYRDQLLPLLSLRAMLGLPGVETQASAKVVVSEVAGTLVGLVADRTRAILNVAEGEAAPPPAVLAARAGGESQIKAIYRGEAGKRLVSILDPDQMFRGEVMQRLSRERQNAGGDDAEGTVVEAAAHFLAFRLDGDEFALPIDAVIEVAVAPERITKLPKAPAFLEGVINFRGEMTPVIDQRRRFDLTASADHARRRLVIVRTERHRAALIVDSVSEVVAAPPSSIDPAPDLAGFEARLVTGVINLAGEGRMIMVLDPGELLSRAERSLLDTFAADATSGA